MVSDLIDGILAEFVESRNHCGAYHMQIQNKITFDKVISHVILQIFILLGIVVNCGGNVDREYIGGKYWNMGDAPFVGGIGGFASVFVTASFA